MKRNQLMVGALLVLAGGIGATTAAARECPDERASHVKAQMYESGKRERCGVGISIFGLELSVFGPSCPVSRFLEPAHGECFGAPLEGYKCVPGGSLHVVYERCECANLTVFGTGVTLPECDCTVQPATGGSVIDWITVACRAD